MSEGAEANGFLHAEVIKIGHRAYDWKIEHDIPVKHWGNVDHLAVSPSGQCFCIDTKSGKGTIILQGKELSKRYGKKTYPFPKSKSILKAVRGQAGQVQQQKGVTWVNPVLCFAGSQVDRTILNAKVHGVLLTDVHSITSVLQSLS